MIVKPSYIFQYIKNEFKVGVSEAAKGILGASNYFPVSTEPIIHSTESAHNTPNAKSAFPMIQWLVSEIPESLLPKNFDHRVKMLEANNALLNELDKSPGVQSPQIL